MAVIQVISMDWAQNASRGWHQQASERVIFELGLGIAWQTFSLRQIEPRPFFCRQAGLCIGQAALRLRGDRVVRSVAILIRLLASTAAPTHNAKRSRPSARQRFMPRPRNSTEMRPSMPARKR